MGQNELRVPGGIPDVSGGHVSGERVRNAFFAVVLLLDESLRRRLTEVGLIVVSGSTGVRTGRIDLLSIAGGDIRRDASRAGGRVRHDGRGGRQRGRSRGRGAGRVVGARVTQGDGSGRGGVRFWGADARLVVVAAIVGHDGVTLQRGLDSLLDGASSDAAAVVLAGSNRALHGLLSILAPAVTVLVFIYVRSALNNQSLLRASLGFRGGLANLRGQPQKENWFEWRRERREVGRWRGTRKESNKKQTRKERGQ